MGAGCYCYYVCRKFWR